MFYLENNHLYRYYCSYDNQLFKTEEDYLAYLKEKGVEPEETYLWRMSKISSKSHFDKDGEWIKFNIAPGTEVFDERDISQYYVPDEAAKERLLKCYQKYNDFYVDRCYYNGYDNSADYVYSDEGDYPMFDANNEIKTFAVYITSYMPDDEKLRAIRMTEFKKQLRNIRRLMQNVRIFAIAQNFKQEECTYMPGLTWCTYDKLGIGKARNTAFDMLYESGYDFGIITDDDITIKETESAKQFYKEIAENPQKFIDMDVIQTRCLCYDMLDHTDIENAEDMSYNWRFRQEYEGQIHMCFFKNFYKYYGVKEYQNEEISVKNNTGFDDTDLFLMLNSKGYKVYKAMFLYRYLGCMTEEESVIEEAADGCFVYNNLTAARLRWMTRLDNGAFDYWKLRGPLPVLRIPRDVSGNVFDELEGHLINRLKAEYLEEQSKKSEADTMRENDEKVKNGEISITDLDII